MDKLAKQCRSCFNILSPKRTVKDHYCSYICYDTRFKHEGYIKTDSGKLFKFFSKEQRRDITNYLATQNIIHTIRYE